MKRYGAWLDGEEVDNGSGQAVMNPVDGEVFAEVADVSSADLDRAFDGAERARMEWARLDAKERRRHLEQWAQHLYQQRHHLAVLEAKQSGQPSMLAQASVEAALRFLQAFSHESFSLVPPGRSGLWLGRQQLDVAVASLPGRYPLAESLYAMAPALAAGTSVVLFPSRTGSLTILEAARLGFQANLPPGLVNVVPVEEQEPLRVRRQPTIRLAVPGEPEQAVSFDRPIRHKGTLVVFRDAALDGAIEGAITAAFGNAGQDGWGASRILVEEEVFGPFMDTFVKRADALRVGDPAEIGVDMGPVRSRTHREMAFQQVLEALDMGAQPALGGQRYPASMVPRGYYYPPTILFHLDPSWPIVQDGVDGPVVTVLSFSGTEQALSLINSFPSSTVSLWSRDRERLTPLLGALSAPIVQVQTHWNTIPMMRAVSQRSDLRQAMMARLGPRQGLVVGPENRESTEGDMT